MQLSTNFTKLIIKLKTGLFMKVKTGSYTGHCPLDITPARVPRQQHKQQMRMQMQGMMARLMMITTYITIPALIR
jgi:hypothetical protein